MPLQLQVSNVYGILSTSPVLFSPFSPFLDPYIYWYLVLQMFLLWATQSLSVFVLHCSYLVLFFFTPDGHPPWVWFLRFNRRPPPRPPQKTPTCCDVPLNKHNLISKIAQLVRICCLSTAANRAHLQKQPPRSVHLVIMFPLQCRIQWTHEVI